jgi:hypothetical protein
MRRQPEREQLNRLTIKTLNQASASPSFMQNKSHSLRVEPCSIEWLRKSGREDLNLRLQRPKRCALTGLRHAPS